MDIVDQATGVRQGEERVAEGTVRAMTVKVKKMSYTDEANDTWWKVVAQSDNVGIRKGMIEGNANDLFEELVERHDLEEQ